MGKHRYEMNPSGSTHYRRALVQTLCWIAGIICIVSCGGYARNYNLPSQEEGTIKSRNLLTFTQQRDFDKLFLEAICQKYKGHTDAAHELLSSALEINPNAAEALYELALIQLGLSPKTDSLLVAEGENMLVKAVQLAPSNRYYRETLAQHWINTGRYTRAAYMYEELVKENPTSENLGTLVRLHEVLGDLPKALARVEQLITHEGLNNKTAMEKFRILLEMGQVAQAFGTMEQLSEENPQELAYRVMLGDLYMEHGYEEKALAIYGDVETTDPGNTLLRMSMLQHYAHKRDSLGFEQNMTALILDPKITHEQRRSILQGFAGDMLRGNTTISPLALYEHFREAFTMEQDDETIAELCLAYIEAAKLPADSALMPLEKLLLIKPDQLQARGQLLSLYASKNETEKIAALCKEGAELHPELLLFHYYQGVALYALDDTTGCIAAYETGAAQIDVDSCPEDDQEIATEIFGGLGSLYHETGDNERCFAAYDKALKINPDDIGTLNNYAYFLALEGRDLERAQQMSTKVAEANPDNDTYLDTHAWVLYCRRQYAQAKIYIDQVLRIIEEHEGEEDPSNATLYDHAGDIYYRCGDRSAALNYWRHALKITDDEELIQKLNKKLKTQKP